MDAPSDVFERLRALPALAAVGGEPGVHVVGGAVRDLLLGREPHEVDLVVEGDAVALAHRLGEVVAVHERFGTATVRVGDDAGAATVDLAGARQETYAAPGALPEVRLGASLARDLERRDFSVNAIAVALDDGRITAVPGALEDVSAGILRILHPGSFADDPTRLLRGARYAARLDFEYDEATARLARAAITEGSLATVTPSRLGAELRLLLREPQPAAIERLARDGLAAALLGEPGPGLRSGAGRPYVRRAVALTPPECEPGLVALAAAWAGGEAAVGRRLRELGLPAAEVTRIAQAVGGAGRVLDGLEPDASGAEPGPGDVDRLLGTGPVELAVLVAARCGPGADAARRWLERDRHRRLAISGDDLVAAGLVGPAVGRGLAAARAAMLDGAAPDRESQIAAALAG
jgi:tRNA nucleotidyltransferase (CCA-adding enzyme)